MEKLLTTLDVAERWRCSKDYVLNQIPKGLEVIKLGKTDYRFELNDVINYEKYLKSLSSNFYRMNSKNLKCKIVGFNNDSYKIV